MKQYRLTLRVGRCGASAGVLHNLIPSTLRGLGMQITIESLVELPIVAESEALLPNN